MAAPRTGYPTGVTLVGRRGVGGFYLLHHHPWLVVLALVVLIALVLYLQRRR